MILTTSNDIMSLNIKRIRKTRGLTQQDMADKLKVQLRKYFRMENDPESRSITELKQIALILNVKFEDFLMNTNVTVGDK